MAKIGRNDPCHCGSGKKYKKCHERADEQQRLDESETWAVAINGHSTVCTKADMKDFENERHLAMHEAAHTVGYWIMGMPIDYVQFNDDRNDKNNHADKLAAVTVGGGRLPDIMALPIGERIAIARQHAFVTLAGPFGGTDAASENPLRKLETTDHLLQAGTKLMHFTGMSKEEAKEEVCRLVPIVNECFDDKAIWNLVNILATILQKKRRIEGEDVLEIINTAYPACKEAAARGLIAVLNDDEETQTATA